MAGGSAQQNLVVAALLALLEEGEVADTDVAALEVDLAVDNPEIEDIVLLEETVIDVIDIGQLVAFGVYSKVVGIALHQEELARQLILGDPWPQTRSVRVQI